MICPITDRPCRTNGCGPKCYKKDTLGYNKPLSFHEWMYIVCERLSTLTQKGVTEVYSSLNLTDAKLSYIDGESPYEYHPAT